MTKPDFGKMHTDLEALAGLAESLHFIFEDNERHLEAVRSLSAQITQRSALPRLDEVPVK